MRERAKQGLDLPAAPEPYEGNLAPIFTCAAAARQDAVELLAADWNSATTRPGPQNAHRRLDQSGLPQVDPDFQRIFSSPA